MSEQATLFKLPYNRFLMQRMEFVVICGDHLAATILRVIEAEMIKRKDAWEKRAEKAIEEKKPVPRKSKTWWIRLSQAQIIARLYMYDSAKLKKPESEDLSSPEWIEYRYKKALSISKATLKKAIELLKDLGFLVERSQPGDEFGAPIYVLNEKNIQAAIEKLPSDPFPIFYHLGGVENSESGGESKIFHVPPENFDSGDSENFEVPPEEFLPGESQNFEVDRDSNRDSLEETRRENEEEESESAHASQPAVGSSLDSPAPTQFVFQIEGWDRFYYHDYCIHAGDKGINDGLTLIVRNLSDVPPHAECSICYKPVHGPHGYDDLPPLEDDEDASQAAPSIPIASTQENKHDRMAMAHDGLGSRQHTDEYSAADRQPLPAQGMRGTDGNQRQPHEDTPRSQQSHGRNERAELGSAPAAARTGAGQQETPPPVAGAGYEKKRGKPAREGPVAVFTPEGQKVYDAWASLFKAPPPAGEQTIKCANDLYARLVPWCQDLRISCAVLLKDIKGFLFATATNGFYKRGVTLCDIHRDFEKWQSAKTEAIEQEAAQAARKQHATSPMSTIEVLRAQQQKYCGGGGTTAGGLS